MFTNFMSLNFMFALLSFYLNTVYVELLDIDECLDNPCHRNANCTDSQGSFYCQCYNGFSGNGFDCTSKVNYSHVIFPINYIIVTLFLMLPQSFVRH